MRYPDTRKVQIEDNYFGTLVQDPYRWLEDDESQETKEWVDAQNAVTQDFLSQIPFRNEIRERLSTLMDYEKFSRPFKEGAYTYFYKNSGLQNQPVLYRQLEDGEPELFLDPNTFSEDATSSLSGISFSKDGSRAAYKISTGGSDWSDVVTIITATGEEIDREVKDIKFSDIAWRGNEGFYYSTYDKPLEGSQLSGRTALHSLYYHRVGTAQEEDELVFGAEQTPRRYISAALTEDERYLVISAANSTSGNELYLQDLTDPNGKIVTVVDNLEKNHTIFYNQASRLYIHTDLNAPNGCVVTTEASEPSPENWKVLIAETENVISPSTGGGRIFANYIRDASSVVLQYDLKGNLEHEITLPGLGTATGFDGKEKEKELYYTFTSYVYPPTIFRYVMEENKTVVFRKSGVDFDPSGYESGRVFFTSKDGTKVPMIITHKKGLVLDGENPALMYGYGGFSVSLTPAFSTSVVSFIEQGGVYAVPNIRGGGEYGEKWHLAGTKLQKQNVFDDFIAGAEFLIDQGFTSSKYLAAMGGSNGGLLVGAMVVQRPELFKVAFPAVGVMDMLRYHQFTAGAGWSFDYGTAEDSKQMFEYLLNYSPVHALKGGVSYPATLITTADHDDRVVPAHSFKFAAQLQELQSGENPVLIRIEKNAGHGAGKPTGMVIQEIADKWAFLFYAMGLSYVK
ncbi:prolyl oligopeptidase family serine peptidase [Pedobacter sp. AW31-3R]|uniref:prolyl oligopeptidase family serine peptidase n=1 Tax=Pedobacter sp. AW31-3R TaxID=3445781 RepID=UPI003F9ECA13